MTNKPTTLKGRAWVIRDAAGKPINNIDTDMIFHNAHLAITDINEMGQHAFGNLQGWEDFPEKVKKGDILIVGENFGAGSSRQQAVDCFVALGVAGLVAESFGAIYKRNAINTAFPLIEFPGIMGTGIENGHEVEIDLDNATFKNLTTGDEIPGMQSFSKVQMDIYQAGSLFKVTP
jgi:3-isopropylmalate dehydratase small subunit